MSEILLSLLYHPDLKPNPKSIGPVRSYTQVLTVAMLSPFLVGFQHAYDEQKPVRLFEFEWLVTEIEKDGGEFTITLESSSPPIKDNDL